MITKSVPAAVERIDGVVPHALSWISKPPLRPRAKKICSKLSELKIWADFRDPSKDVVFRDEVLKLYPKTKEFLFTQEW